MEILWTQQQILSPDLFLSDAHSEYTNNITEIYRIFFFAVIHTDFHYIFLGFYL